MSITFEWRHYLVLQDSTNSHTTTQTFSKTCLDEMNGEHARRVFELMKERGWRGCLLVPYWEIAKSCVEMVGSKAAGL